jgi:hypothetical protein
MSFLNQHVPAPRGSPPSGCARFCTSLVWAILSAASWRSAGATIWYLSSMLLVRCPVMLVATGSDKPRFSMSRTAVRRRSCRSIRGHPALRHVPRQAFLMFVQGPAFRRLRGEGNKDDLSQTPLQGTHPHQLLTFKEPAPRAAGLIIRITGRLSIFPCSWATFRTFRNAAGSGVTAAAAFPSLLRCATYP